MEKRLIVGLGNPGSTYNGTRHNVGFQIVRSLSEKQGLSWRQTASVKGELAQGYWGETKVLLLMPTTYMNCSGEAVRLCLDYFDIPLEHLLVVVDEIALPLGKVRLRPQGSAGGHNGLKSVEQYLRTQYYARLRIGIGDREQGNLADHVLGRFTEEESRELPQIIEKAVALLDVWILQGLAAAMQSANQS